MDPTLNSLGRQQAERLGQALARVVSNHTVVAASPLQRAQETAVIASRQFQSLQSPAILSLPFLSEVDFGSKTDGSPIQQVGAGMASIYSAWALGQLDMRMPGDGESGTEVYP